MAHSGQAGVLGMVSWANQSDFTAIKAALTPLGRLMSSPPDLPRICKSIPVG